MGGLHARCICLLALVPVPQLHLVINTFSPEAAAFSFNLVRADLDQEVLEVLRLRESNEMLALDLLPDLFLRLLEYGRGDLALVCGAERVVEHSRGLARQADALRSPLRDELLEHLVGGFPLRGIRFVHVREVVDGLEEALAFKKTLKPFPAPPKRGKGEVSKQQ